MTKYLSFVLVNALLVVNVGAIWTKFDLVRPWLGAWGSSGVTPFIKIGALEGNGPILNTSAQFGWSVANVGDINGDGYPDLAVGAIGESCTRSNGTVHVRSGAVYLLFLAADAQVISYKRITCGIHGNGGPTHLISNDNFGYAITSVGDLDSDGVPDIAVGAPGTYAGSLYTLFMNSDGSVKSYAIIRGPGLGNGPPIKYQERFSSSLANIGDLDGDNVTDLAVGAIDDASGDGKVYIFYMQRDGSVREYVRMLVPEGEEPDGTPIYQDPFIGFGAAVVALGDVNGDGITDIAIGAKGKTDPTDGYEGAGCVYVCQMNRTGEILNVTRINQVTSPMKKRHWMQVERNDGCGAGLASLGDLNRDDWRAQNPYIPRVKNRENFPSVPDIIVGCSQEKAVGKSGRIVAVYLNQDGWTKGYTEFLGEDEKYAPELKQGDLFGASMTGLWDADENGITELAVGAPGDGEVAFNGGAVYIFFFRRKRHHPVPFDWLTYWLMLLFPPAIVFFLCVIGCAVFFYKFRRKPSEIELAVKRAGIKTGLDRKRHKLVKVAASDTYADEYA